MKNTFNFDMISPQHTHSKVKGAFLMINDK